MGAFLNNLYEEGTATEIAYWLGRRVAELEAGTDSDGWSAGERVNYNVIMTGTKQQLLAELAKVTPY